MILIAGSPVPVDTTSWPPTARYIYELKRNSPYVFNYSSVNHLKFEMLLRAEIIRAARDLNDSGVEFATFEFARTNEMYWHLTPQGGFQLRAGVRPADAIRDIFYNGYAYAFECATAIPIIYYKAVLEVLGDQTFNRLFQDLLLYSWNFDSDLGLIQELVSVDRAFPGDVLYFSNPDHHPRAPEWQGVNVVLLGDDLFYGHGVGITTGRDIIRGLNMRRRPFSFRSAYLMDLIVYPDFQYLSKFMPSASSSTPAAASSSATTLPATTSTATTPTTATSPAITPTVMPTATTPSVSSSTGSPIFTIPMPTLPITPPYSGSPAVSQTMSQTTSFTAQQTGQQTTSSTTFSTGQFAVTPTWESPTSSSGTTASSVPFGGTGTQPLSQGSTPTDSTAETRPPAEPMSSMPEAKAFHVQQSPVSPATDPPWLSLPPIDTFHNDNRIRARVGRRRTIM